MNEDRFSLFELFVVICITVVVTLSLVLLGNVICSDENEKIYTDKDFSNIVIKTNFNQEQTYLVLLIDEKSIRRSIDYKNDIEFTNYELLVNSERKSVFTKKNRIFIPFNKIDYIIFETK